MQCHGKLALPPPHILSLSRQTRYLQLASHTPHQLGAKGNIATMPQPSANRQAFPFWANERTVALLIVAYLALHFMLRMAMWPALGIDDAEQAMFAQQFEWSYRFRAPPLFTWMLLVLQPVTGPGILAISIIRYALIGVTLWFAYCTARILLPDPRLAALAVFAFPAIYVFGYYSHHDLTHTTAMVAALSVAWYLGLRLVAGANWPTYALFGISAGLGLIGKWNFATFLICALLAALATKQIRQNVLGRPAVWLIPIMLLAIAGPSMFSTVYWGVEKHEGYAELFGAYEQSLILSRLLAVLDLAIVIAIYTLPFLLVAVPAFWSDFRRANIIALFNPQTTIDGDSRFAKQRRFAALTTMIAIGFYFLISVATGASKIDERLLQPALFVVPILFFTLIGGPNLTNHRLSQFAMILGAIAAIALAARVVVYLYESRQCQQCRAHLPFELLVDEIKRDGFSGAGTIVTGYHHIGGNFRPWFPDVRIVSTSYPLRYWPPATTPAGDCLAVWINLHHPHRLDVKRAERFAEFVDEDLNGDLGEATIAREVELPILGGGQTRLFSYRIVKGGTGDCR